MIELNLFIMIIELISDDVFDINFVIFIKWVLLILFEMI